MKRRALIATAASGMTAGAIAAPAIAQDVIRWNMVMPWPRNTPGVGINAERFAQRVNAMSAGRLEIKLYAAGELVPPFEELDTVSRGTADIAHGTPYYAAGKAPVLHYFTTIPFGLMAPELAPKVRVNAIEVGGVETDALATVLTDENVRRQLEDNTPMRRVGQVEDIAAAALYLVSPASSWVTGKVFEVDGGVESPAFTVPTEEL